MSRYGGQITLRKTQPRWIWVITTIVVLSALSYRLHQRSLQAALLRQWPTELEHNPQLLRFATSMARPVYAANCAACHGASLAGDDAVGAPNLSDAIWLYGDGGIGDIENTILYGIRSGHPKAHNVTDMPAEGRTHQLAAPEVDDVVEFVMALSRQPHDEIAPSAVASSSTTRAIALIAMPPMPKAIPITGHLPCSDPHGSTAVIDARCTRASTAAGTACVRPGLTH